MGTLDNKTGAKHLGASEVRRCTDPASLGCATTVELSALNNFIGQERAVRAVDFGMSVPSKGYNIFVVGPQGSGRTSYALRCAKERAASMPAPDDWIYVNNFKNPSSPIAISVPAGQAKLLEKDFTDLVEELKSVISGVFEKSSYEDAKAQEISSFQEEINKIMVEVRAEAEKQDFLVKRTPQGFVNIPLRELTEEELEKQDKDDEAVSDIKEGFTEMQTDEYEALSEEQKKFLKEISDSLTSKTLEALRTIREKERALKSRLTRMEAEICRTAIKPYIDEITVKYKSGGKFKKWLKMFEDEIVDNFAIFIAASREENAEVDFSAYGINPIVCNNPDGGAPVVWENNPTYYNLAGKMEYESRQGYYHTDFSRIVSGSLHRANGGFLILDAEELLRNFMSYDALKRALRSGTLTVENLSDLFGAMPISSPRPESIPISTKVILVGSYYIYYLLQQYDSEFSKVFKTVAEFDSDMKRTPENELDFARFIKTEAEMEHCLPFDSGALAEMIELSSRLADDQNKLSTEFNRLKEFIIEASAWAGNSGSDVVTREHVLKAIEEKRYRSGLTEEKIREAFEEDIIRIDTDGSAVGQINGLAVVSFAEVAFGFPSRITANTYMGQEGVISIEREISTAGPIHNKGLMTLSSYLGRIYAQKMPLTLTARISFEQNYGGIDGDSASSTELYCLLSSLADVPIRQDIAVTGSVDQFGNIQPIGGVNEKIEGFFSYCRSHGFTGSQGVMIPWQNARHLMLNHEIADAVEQGRFHIWTVRTIDEGLELLTGKKAGKPDSKGEYPARSIHGRAIRKLRKWIEISAGLSGGGKAKDGEDKKTKSRASKKKKDDKPASPSPDMPTPEPGKKNS